MSEAPSLPTPGPSDAGRVAGRRELVVLLSIVCLPVLGTVLIAPVLPQMVQAFADTPGVDVLVPLTLAAPALMIALTAPFAGLVIDKLDRRRLLIAALVAYAVFGTAPLYLDSLPAVLGSRVLVGLTEGAITTCATTFIGDYWSGRRRARYLGLQTLVATLSATVFLALGGVLGAAGWRVPFWLYAAAIPLAVVVAATLWQPQRPADQAAPTAARTPVPWRQVGVPSLVTLVGGVLFYALIVELSLVLAGVGVTSPAVIGVLAAIMSLATAAGAVLFTRFVQLGVRVLLSGQFAGAAIGLLLVAATGSPVVITVGAVITGFSTGMMLPTLLTWAVRDLAFAQRGRGTGVWTASQFSGQFLCPLLLAGIGAAVGGLQPALGVLGVVAIVGAIAALVGLRGAGRPDTATVEDATTSATGPGREVTA